MSNPKSAPVAGLAFATFWFLLALAAARHAACYVVPALFVEVLS